MIYKCNCCLFTAPVSSHSVFLLLLSVDQNIGGGEINNKYCRAITRIWKGQFSNTIHFNAVMKSRGGGGGQKQWLSNSNNTATSPPLTNQIYFLKHCIDDNNVCTSSEAEHRLECWHYYLTALKDVRVWRATSASSPPSSSLCHSLLLRRILNGFTATLAPPACRRFKLKCAL